MIKNGLRREQRLKRERNVARRQSILRGEKIRVLEEQQKKNKKEIERLKRRSSIDQLTQAYRKDLFDNLLEKEIGRAQRFNKPLSLMTLDLDSFKAINDSYGHSVGDIVLRRLGKIFQEQRKATDWVVRVGGDEFVLILVDCDKEGALVQAVRLQEQISKDAEVKLGACSVAPTVSIGIAVWEEGEKPSHFYERADTRLLAAKARGKNMVVAE